MMQPKEEFDLDGCAAVAAKRYITAWPVGWEFNYVYMHDVRIKQFASGQVIYDLDRMPSASKAL
jgi:hypothetical protein